MVDRSKMIHKEEITVMNWMEFSSLAVLLFLALMIEIMLN